MEYTEQCYSVLLSASVNWYTDSDTPLSSQLIFMTFPNHVFVDYLNVYNLLQSIYHLTFKHQHTWTTTLTTMTTSITSRAIEVAYVSSLDKLAGLCACFGICSCFDHAGPAGAESARIRNRKWGHSSSACLFKSGLPKLRNAAIMLPWKFEIDHLQHIMSAFEYSPFRRFRIDGDF